MKFQESKKTCIRMEKTKWDASNDWNKCCQHNGVSVLQTVLVSAGQCDSVFKGFSDCLLQLGENMANYPQDLDDRENLHKICSYWDNFHSCATTALADCQEGATDLWEKLKKESRNLDFRGSLFELCGGGNGAPRSADARGLALFLTTLPTILTWLAF
ncbi:neuritin isoform X1 [Cheilinus undulatus]|uniref:neuritin isoform X1 n=1 Tax=Cheilinus undulatus TaxID=241271 RepID=UPI001BD6283A|nr:neuritin isoform X1 [Cheilinus undulatus]